MKSGTLKDHSIRVEVSRKSSALDLIAKEYESLLNRAEWINPYFSPEWMHSWWDRQKQDRQPLILMAISEDGVLLGYWPFVERPGMLGAKGLWPFVYDEANYHFPTCEKKAASLLVDALSNLLGCFLFAWVPQVPQTFWSDHMSEAVAKSKHLKIIRSDRSSPIIKPNPEISFAKYWEGKVGAKSRKSLRHDERALAGCGEISWEIKETFEDVRSVMPATCLIEVESKKTRENAGLYPIRGRRGFFFELLPHLAKSARVRLSFLRVDDHPVAWQLEFLCPGFSYLHHLAFDENWRKYSPGKQLLKRSMEQCWNEGRAFDFLPAPFDYKQNYTNFSMPMHELHWIKSSLRGYLARKLIRWNMQWRQKIRERSPGLAASIARDQVTQANKDLSK